MELVLNPSQIRDNALRFDGYRTSTNPTELNFFKKTLGKGRHFVCFKKGTDYIFCPSRFCGYQKNSVRAHEAHKAGKTVDGRDTDDAISVWLGPSRPHPQAETLFRELCETVGVTPTKYQQGREYWLLSPLVEPTPTPSVQPLVSEINLNSELSSSPPDTITKDDGDGASVDPQTSQPGNTAEMDFDIELDVRAEKFEANGDYDASSEADAREFVMRAIAYRRGQPHFRERLINAYEGRCAVTECSVHQVLEAAHIKPFCENQNTTYVVSNGILLRSDIHTLFDAYLMGINPDDFTLTFAESVMRGKYKKLNGKRIRRPADDRLKPSKDLLRERWLEFCARNGHAT